MNVYDQTFRWLRNLTDVITDDSRRLFFVNGKHIADQRHTLSRALTNRKFQKKLYEQKLETRSNATSIQFDVIGDR